MSDKGERNMLARANYRGFHVQSNVVSDPPTLRSVMEAEAEVLKAFTSDTFSFEVGQGVRGR